MVHPPTYPSPHAAFWPRPLPVVRAGSLSPPPGFYSAALPSPLLGVGCGPSGSDWTVAAAAAAAAMAEAGREQGRDPPRFVYVTRFGSHRCGGVLQLRGPRARGRGSPAGQQGEAAGAPGSGLTQKNLAKMFDFPIPLNEASKVMKKKKKASVWNNVYKIISRMLEENEKYRLRLKCQRLSS
ncbi:putative protein C5orf47, partial [Galemys pyrenaicus]